jgi:hypothetical protein
MRARLDKVFTKVLVARFSPQNQCYVPDGTLLYVRPLIRVPKQEHVGHHFLSVRDTRTTSKYGWVSETPAFSLEEFAALHLRDVDLGEADRAHIETMLLSIARLQRDAPVAASYSLRGVETKQMEFAVHPVVFHEA